MFGLLEDAMLTAGYVQLLIIATTFGREGGVGSSRRGPFPGY